MRGEPAGLTAAQRETLAAPDRLRAWMVLAGDGFIYVTVDQGLAQKYAANTGGVVLPMRPEPGSLPV